MPKQKQTYFVLQVAAWKARGVVPALLEVTADIVSCVVHEDDCAKHWNFSGHVLRLQYAMALTRSVWVQCATTVYGSLMQGIVGRATLHEVYGKFTWGDKRMVIKH